MIESLRARARDARYALPQKVELYFSGPGIEVTARRCARLARQGLASTVGYFQASDATPDEIVTANVGMLECWQGRADRDYLSVKAPPLRFDFEWIRKIASAGADAGMALLFDAHAPKDAEATLGTVAKLLADYPTTGFALPARWRRSRSDALRFKDTMARIRIVKGEWPDPEFSGDVDDDYLAMVGSLAGRKAPVAVATHDPRLAERALTQLLEARTPCELEQLRGLPRRQTTEIAVRLGVPIRIYTPFGPGWWPYAIDKALARPYIMSWTIRDRLSKSRSSEGSRPSPFPDPLTLTETRPS